MRSAEYSKADLQFPECGCYRHEPVFPELAPPTLYVIGDEDVPGPAVDR